MAPENIPRDPVYNTPNSGLTYTDQQGEEEMLQQWLPPGERGGAAPPPRRPASAPPGTYHAGSSSTTTTAYRSQQQTASPTLRLDLRGITLADNMVTSTGRPSYTMAALVEADLESGVPLEDLERPATERKGRAAVVQTYPVAPSMVGYGSGGVRPFHQDYRHYKYFGFAGKGAKTSWAHNPKYSKLYADLLTSGGRDSTAPGMAQNGAPTDPLQEELGGPRRPLTATERKLVNEFKWHNYEAEGIPSDPNVTRLLAHVAAGVQPTPRTLRHLKLHPQKQQQQQQLQRRRREAATAERQRQQLNRIDPEIIEPYRALVDLERRQALPADANSTAGKSYGTRVMTYRQMASPYAAEINRSPNHGSQSPWHQRYAHYKYSGFAGKGASSSWARNPKYAYMYD
ncbi:hypothetical protein VOLCADRAFT_89966 [Volvox carteri f. nagariensis]|uniref:Uncharacterized protein n=1 Tax=Volvox carteri f. nagariensis TaxID=3068 RepID=D8TT48_VOLCA|nr:uncharacterized protein VOLCADRAFT_89966 [Volvox carteri f. nagariensis]EFJ49132.1 hypothetical protein VOLCADRAFT_89966 [Volvox carteri f. nagariensis]|eukprot:XP_002949580.1 hypothetical protein VOLCADRAFT_89966 [Volvox carteri f. nagariensis]